MSEKLQAGGKVPEISLKTVDGGSAKIGGAREGWQLVVVYRGKHCPICKRYLTGLNELIPGYTEAKIEVIAVSADSEEKSKAFADEVKPSFPIAYGLSIDDARRLGLYISNPRSPQETDKPFAEPGLFVVNPKGEAQIVDISNAPFSRPDLGAILNGLKFVQANNYPIRGTA
ncbi:MAG: peroxiredoxin-like family protein [Planctomycetia bacterium]|nr:peroxiredoxin-like family protein [Planctomycetia bacterium]